MKSCTLHICFLLLNSGSWHLDPRRFQCTVIVFWTHVETLIESVLKEQWVRVVCVLNFCWMRVELLLKVCYACAAPPPQEQMQPPVEALPNGTSVTVFQCNRWNCSYWPWGTSVMTWMAIEADNQLSVLQWNRLRTVEFQSPVAAMTGACWDHEIYQLRCEV